nr:MAG TPA: nucelotide kinase [Caudoviricetes sp.]
MSKKRQVGGSHYSRLKIEPIDLMVKLKFNWFQGEILKYVSRFRYKNGKEDLRKAFSVCTLAIDRGLNQATLFSDDLIDSNKEYMEKYIDQFKFVYLKELIKEIIEALVKNDYYLVQDIINVMIIKYYG